MIVTVASEGIGFHFDDSTDQYDGLNAIGHGRATAKRLIAQGARRVDVRIQTELEDVDTRYRWLKGLGWETISVTTLNEKRV